MKRAVLFLNLGGPENQDGVKPFLYRLFVDPEIIRVKFTPLRQFIAWMISTSREKKAQGLYQKMGGGSPIRRLTDQQSKGVEALLRQEGYDVAVRTAFTCSPPLVEDVVRDLVEVGVRQIMAFPLYPQYSYTTSKGAFDRTRAAVERYGSRVQYFEQGSFPTHPLFIQAHAELIEKELSRAPDPKSDVHLIFSAHSIPEKLVTKEGDPYKDQMQKTVQAIVEKLNWEGPWSLSWQSKLGPVKWLAPSTEDTLKKLGAEGIKRVCIDPVAFVTDHVETLVELDEELKLTAEQSGIKEFYRVPGLNDHPTFLSCLATLIKAKKEFWEQARR